MTTDRKPHPVQARALAAGLDHPGDFFYVRGRGLYAGDLTFEPVTFRSMFYMGWVDHQPASRPDPARAVVSEEIESPDPARYAWGPPGTLGIRLYVTAAGAAAIGRIQNPALLDQMDRRRRVIRDLQVSESEITK
jgi:hypothetical protein